MGIDEIKTLLKSGDVAGAGISILTETPFCIRQLETERIIKEMTK